jgi:hypothetical protein
MRWACPVRFEPDWGGHSPQVEAGRPQADPIEPDGGRQSPKRLAVSAALLSVALGGCPALLSDTFRIDDEAGSGGVGADATLPEAASDASLDGGAAMDAASEQGGDGGSLSDGEGGSPTALCCPRSSDPLGETTFDHWVPLGTVRSFPAYTELCEDKRNQAGGIFSPTEEPMTDFELRFDFSITKSADGGVPADGLAFVAMTDLTGSCEAGSNLCVLGTSPGFGVLVRTYSLAKEPAAPYVAFIDTSRPLSAEAGPPILGGLTAHIDGGLVVIVPNTTTDPPAGSWRKLCVRVASGAGTVVLDGTPILADVAVPALGEAHWGFVGATGSSFERSAIRRLVIRGSVACGDAEPCVADADLCAGD